MAWNDPNTILKGWVSYFKSWKRALKGPMTSSLAWSITSELKSQPAFLKDLPGEISYFLQLYPTVKLLIMAEKYSVSTSFPIYFMFV